MASAGFHSLDSVKKEAFRDRLGVLGLREADVVGRSLHSASCAAGAIRVCGDLARTQVVTHLRTIHDVREMKRIGGVSDTIARSPAYSASYPPELNFDASRLLTRYPDRTALEWLLGMDRRAMVRSAYQAWLLGDSERVRDLGYEPLINALFFPQRVYVAAIDTITVADGHTATFGQGGDYPTALQVVDITLEGSGSVKFLSDYSLGVTGTLAQTPA